MALGLIWLSTLAPDRPTSPLFCRAMTLFAIGLVLVVAPVTTAALIDIGPAQSGTASGVNNAVARVAGSSPSRCFRLRRASARQAPGWKRASTPAC